MPRRELPVPVERGEIIAVRCESLADGPDAIARVDGYVLLVQGALAGEMVRAEVMSAARKHGRAEMVEVLQPSPLRVEPGCEHFGECGGCQLQHLAHEGQLRARTQRVQKALSHALDRPVAVRPCRGPEDPWGQRTKVAMHVAGGVGAMVVGHIVRGSVEVLEIESCPVAHPRALGLARAIGAAARELGVEPWDPDTDRGVLRAIVVRASATSGEALATLVVRRRPRGALGPLIQACRDAGAEGVAVAEHDGPFSQLVGDPPRRVAGATHIEEEIAGIRFRISAGSFFQTSAWGARALVATVAELVAPPPDAVILDLYCGGGLLGLSLAPRVRRVLGVEENAAAIADAEATATANGIRNAAFRAAPVERVARYLAHGSKPPFAVLLDPPRAGCPRSVLRAVAHDIAPQRIGYVSCDPDSLARDAVELERLGYHLGAVQPLDMFPHTAHVETVAIFDRRPRPDLLKQRMAARLAREDAGAARPDDVPDPDRRPAD